MRWTYEGGQAAQAIMALLAAAVCFTSWLTRTRFNRWAAAFALEMVEDATNEFKKMADDVQRDTASDGDEAEPR